MLKYLGFSWAGYRKVRKGIKKRIYRHMHRLGCRNMEAYLHKLDRNPDLRHHCEQLMAVSISRFFRDRKLWERLQSDILPELITKNRKKIRVWSAGCASGEEIYSFRIVWDRLQTSNPPLPGLELTATDINPAYIERAKNGVYPPSSLREVSEELRSAYFQSHRHGKQYEVVNVLKRGITWRQHHLLSDPQGVPFHLIFLRNNILTYYDQELRNAAFDKVNHHLHRGGYLVIGAHEKLPGEKGGLVPFGDLSYVFKKG